MRLCSLSPIQLPLITQENYMNRLEDFQLQIHSYNIQGRQLGAESCCLSLVLPALTPQQPSTSHPEGQRSW